MRPHSVGASSLLRRGFLTPPHKQELPILRYHSSARGKALHCALSAPSTSETGDEGRPVEAGPYRFPVWAGGALVVLAAAVAAAVVAVVALMKIGGTALVSIGESQFRPLRLGGINLIKFPFIVSQSQTPPAIC